MHLEWSPKPTLRGPEYLNVSMAPLCIMKDMMALIASCHFAVPNALLMVSCFKPNPLMAHSQVAKSYTRPAPRPRLRLYARLLPLPAMPRDTDAAYELASQNLDGAHSRCTRPATPLR
jgi:hypothetical protein